MLRERMGAQIDVCPLTQDGRIDLDAMSAMLTPQHKLVALAHVSNVLGSVLDVRRASRYGALRWVPSADRRLSGGAAPAGDVRQIADAISMSFRRTSSTARPASARCGRGKSCSMPCRPIRVAAR
jgi:hypothetical protein